MPAYDSNNIFAKILRGELPSYKIYEDDKALAFLDIMPRAPGHALVLPKAASRNILDVAPDDLAHVMKVAQRIAKVSVEVFGADGVTVQQFNEAAGEPEGGPRGAQGAGRAARRRAALRRCVESLSTAGSRRARSSIDAWRCPGRAVCCRRSAAGCPCSSRSRRRNI